ncbi:type III-B CRISPR-associated protein Cas10/Cmr2 [Pueribacillus theae]|uniref:Type III-B CRISPR-associated protein Cas10/Cmr2 n=1 Tax=Pueribacillus theae TaxID=2171751 RepID=A0A2U1K823_9BACI|nr:type III-B CRISPR-associated protein Cas10/Cmr2 [Pueribacillus theae]PWA13088.1 type III-B CRISPR-associated protein Cas10/Cmr2 [Pueribacillus theae]
MKTYLFVYSIGPVQSFIAAARKTEDFWSSSYLLSYLNEKTIRAALESKQHNVKLLSPAVTIEQLDEQMGGGSADVAALPNRFLLRLDANQDLDVISFAKQLEQRTIVTFQELATDAINKVFGTLNEHQYIKRLADKQLSEFVEIFWAFEEWTNKVENASYNNIRLTVEKRLASVKNNRIFTIQAQNALVCTVCGSREALNTGDISDSTIVQKNVVKDKDARIKDNERLCAVCLTKRLARGIFKERFEKEKQLFQPFPSVFDFATQSNPYYAIIMMDGDDMGKWISGIDNKILSGFKNIDEAYHEEISRRLTVFSGQSVPNIVKQSKGRLVYAGGDDVLAFVPLDELLSMIQSLREVFSSENGLDMKATASMGVVIAHKKEPLQRVLTTVRELEGKAKAYKNNVQQKDAVAFGLISKSGQIRRAIVPWYLDEKKQLSVIEIMIRLREVLGETLSSTFLYHFYDAFSPIMPQGEKADLAQEIIDLEFRRLISRASKNLNQNELNSLTEDLLKIYSISLTFVGFLHLLEIIRFMSGKIARKEEDQ